MVGNWSNLASIILYATTYKTIMTFISSHGDNNNKNKYIKMKPKMKTLGNRLPGLIIINYGRIIAVSNSFIHLTSINFSKIKCFIKWKTVLNQFPYFIYVFFILCDGFFSRYCSFAHCGGLQT